MGYNRRLRLGDLGGHRLFRHIDPKVDAACLQPLSEYFSDEEEACSAYTLPMVQGALRSHSSKTIPSADQSFRIDDGISFRLGNELAYEFAKDSPYCFCSIAHLVWLVCRVTHYMVSPVDG